MTHLPSVAIVVLNYNGLPLLKAYLPTLLRYSNDYSIMVVDNGSTDGSITYLKSHFPTVTCMVHDANYGVAKRNGSSQWFVTKRSLFNSR